MKTIRAKIEVNTDTETLFDLTQNYSRRLEWDPYLVEAYLLGDVCDAAVGVESYCKTVRGRVMISRYISFMRPKVAAVEMIKGPFILKSFCGAWNVKYIEENISQLRFTYNYELKGGVVGRLLLPISSYLFSKDMKTRLKSIKAFIEAETPV